MCLNTFCKFISIYIQLKEQKGVITKVKGKKANWTVWSIESLMTIWGHWLSIKNHVEKKNYFGKKFSYPMPSGNVFVIIFNKIDPRSNVRKPPNCLFCVVYNVLNISVSQLYCIPWTFSWWKHAVNCLSFS